MTSYGYSLENKKGEMKMSFSQKSRAVMENWDKEEFKKNHHPDYMFIRETELVTLDDWADRMENGSSVVTLARIQKNDEKHR
jgi:hypothetical protein